jgi:hypothetical protein
VLPRKDARESAEERVRFFEKDPVLFEKHPGRYPALFFAEAHYRSTRGFWDAFRSGVRRYGTRIPAAALLHHPLAEPDAFPAWFRKLAGA